MEVLWKTAVVDVPVFEEAIERIRALGLESFSPLPRSKDDP